MHLVKEDAKAAPSHVRLGIIRLGRAAGKIKYCVLDEVDVPDTNAYVFEPKVEIDPNGDGVRIFAVGHRANDPSDTGYYAQDIIWNKYRGEIAKGWEVIHKNCIPLDNRIENLALVPSAVAKRWCKHTSHSPVNNGKGDNTDFEKTVYFSAITQLPIDPHDELLGSRKIRYLNDNGEYYETYDDSQMFYECRYAPCIAMETTLREFSICGRCQEARYCGVLCQQRDWNHHRQHCRVRKRFVPRIISTAIVPNR